MVALQIRDVPDEVRDILADRARQEGKSLQAYLLDLVKTDARRNTNLALLRQFEGRNDGTNRSMADIVADLEAARAERGAQLGLRPGDSQ